MKCLRACSFWRPWFAAILVAMLVLAPVLQGHAAAAHPDNFDVQLHHEHGDTQDANCCIDGEKSDHSLGAECGACVLPCLSSLHSLFHDVTAMTFFTSASRYLAADQITDGLATAPGLRPPKTHS